MSFIITFVLAQAVVFLGLVILLRRVMRGSADQETRRLQEMNEEQRKKLQGLARQIDRAEREYREKLRLADQEARKVKERVLEEAAREKERVLKEAEEEKKEILRRALNAREKLKDEAAEEMKRELALKACGMIREVLTERHQRWLQQGLIDEAVDELASLDQAVFDGLAETDSPVVEVTTAHELDEEQKKRICRVLSDRLRRPVACREILKASVIAGIVVRVGSLLVDGSLAERLRRLA